MAVSRPVIPRCTWCILASAFENFSEIILFNLTPLFITEPLTVEGGTATCCLAMPPLLGFVTFARPGNYSVLVHIHDVIQTGRQGPLDGHSGALRRFYLDIEPVIDANCGIVKT